MQPEQVQLIRSSLMRLVDAQTAAISLLQGSIQTLQIELDALGSTSPFQSNLPTRHDSLKIDREIWAVTFRGHCCELGDSLQLRFLERLLRSPDHYVSYEHLLEDVWQENRDDTAVRSLVKVLRHKLRCFGMSEVANAIDGHVKRHYRLKLSDLE